MLKGQWKFKWINSWDEVWSEDFVSRWHVLMKVSPEGNVFFEPSIVRAWYETYRKLRDIEPRFLIASWGNDCEVFFPLIFEKGRWKDGWQNVLYAAGKIEFDYHDPIGCKDLPDEAKRIFWTDFRDEIVRLRDRIDIVSIPRIREVWGSEGSGLLRPVAKAPFIELGNFKTIEELLLSLHSKFRRNMGRQKRRLYSLGTLELKIIRDSNKAIDILPDLERARIKKWPCANRTKNFYHNLVKSGLESGIVCLSVLESDGRAISWSLGFLYKGRYYNYILVFDPEMAIYSPGNIHVAMLIKEAVKQKLQVCDFMLGEEAYKFKWTNGSRSLYEYEWKSTGIMSGIRHNIRNILRYAANIKRRVNL